MDENASRDTRCKCLREIQLDIGLARDQVVRLKIESSWFPRYVDRNTVDYNSKTGNITIINDVNGYTKSFGDWPYSYQRVWSHTSPRPLHPLSPMTISGNERHDYFPGATCSMFRAFIMTALCIVA